MSDALALIIYNSSPLINPKRYVISEPEGYLTVQYSDTRIHHFQDKCLFAFYAEIQDGKKCNLTLRIPCGPKFSSKLLYLATFLRY